AAAPKTVTPSSPTTHPSPDHAAEATAKPSDSDAACRDDHALWRDNWSDLGTTCRAPRADSYRPERPRSVAADGVKLFQHAMLELIAAARTALDTAEELVADPTSIGTAVESLRGFALEAFRGGLHSARSAVTPDEDDDFQSIRVDDD